MSAIIFFCTAEGVGGRGCLVWLAQALVERVPPKVVAQSRRMSLGPKASAVPIVYGLVNDYIYDYRDFGGSLFLG